MVDDFRTA